MNEEEKVNNKPIILKIDKNEKLNENTDNLYNFGYVALSKVYHELEIDKFILNQFKNRNINEFKLNNSVDKPIFCILCRWCHRYVLLYLCFVVR